jgi:hypothetical protein
MKRAIVQRAGQTPIYRVLVIAGSVGARRIGPQVAARVAQVGRDVMSARNLRSLISKTGRCP